jgi:very-short-patch-repair endonuclease
MPTDRQHRHHPLIRRAALEMRHPQTPAEARLWACLRGQQLGLKFRRQHPIDCYIADFYCAACCLVIEVDGPSHLEQAMQDEERTAWLEANGYHVIRFSNADVLQGLDQVLGAIAARCQELLTAEGHTQDDAD